VQKFLQDNGDKLSSDDKQTLQDAMDAVKSALDRSAKAEELDQLSDKLMDEWQKVGAKMYQQAGPQTPPPGEDGPTDGPTEGGEDVVDGEYRKM
jgi:molecular chaperone DnaK